MFHGPKAFFLSVNGGRTWQRRSEALIPGGPDPSGIPTLDMTANLAAASPTTFYMATVNEVCVSDDAGRTWKGITLSDVASRDFAPGGTEGAIFSFLDPEHGWLLIPHESLLRTTDGRVWTVLDMSPL